MKMCDLYVKYRHQGLSREDAATKAGFSKGVPSPQARRLWRAAKKIHRIPEGALDRYRERIRQKERELREMRDIQRAIEVLSMG